MGAAQPFESETKIGLGTTDDSSEQRRRMLELGLGGERADRAMQYYVELRALAGGS